MYRVIVKRLCSYLSSTVFGSDSTECWHVPSAGRDRGRGEGRVVQ